MRKAAPRRVSAIPSPDRQRIRCAIYTRKSSEEGLEQAFNSLDAQREACEAFILSQRSEGWTALPQLYDDGGISGATMERPALIRLLADISAGRVDTVVVYKVDRLTRSLNDFARIVDVFDKAGVSFVSVTQQFNTTTSMGRLTLNMLLSFAQFEREVTGERIRDKIAASKAKGMWMGGNPPLGYDVRDRQLVINEAEARTVRAIYRRYLELGSVRALRDDLHLDGMISKRRVNRFGRETGGKPFARGALYLMLQNRIYRGEITHKGKSYSGQHQSIVDQALWDGVQSLLVANRIDRNVGARAKEPSLLAGLVWDETGDRMTPSHANKKGTRYRYYVSQRLIAPGRGIGAAPAGRRIPASDLEELVEGRIVAFLRDQSALHDMLAPAIANVADRSAIVEATNRTASEWPSLDASAKRSLCQRLMERITLQADAITIVVRQSGILSLVPWSSNPTLTPERAPAALSPDANIVLTAPAIKKRTGVETRLIVNASSGHRREQDRSLLRMLAQAQSFRDKVLSAYEERSVAEMAAEASVTTTYFTRVLKLSFLAPDVITAVLDERHPAELTARRLSLDIELPLSWADQKSALGIV